jgi:hypothetical protein
MTIVISRERPGGNGGARAQRASRTAVPGGGPPPEPTWSDPGVTRRVGSTVSAVAQRLGRDEGPRSISLGSLGELRVDKEAGPGPPASGALWHTTGRLVGAGPRLARFTRIDIEVRPASPRTVEVRLFPRSAHVHRWAARRYRRYFRLAHAAADQLTQVLSA